MLMTTPMVCRIGDPRKYDLRRALRNHHKFIRSMFHENLFSAYLHNNFA